MKKVIFLVHRLHQYRVDFYNLLKKELEKEGIELLLIYSQSKQALKKDEVDIPWGIVIPSKRFSIFGMEFYWQPVKKYLNASDLIIVQQANRLLLNYYLILFRKLHKIKMAYWGHGLNLQLPQNNIANKFKKLLIARTDWWFTYTKKVKNIVAGTGYDENKITIVNNAIDTKKLIKEYSRLNGQTTEKIRKELNLTTDNIGIFCGGIYEEKRIEFLIEATDLVKQKVPDFQLIVIGSGPDETKLKELMKTRDYIKFVGPKFHEDRVPYFKVSKVFLMPGLVGLGVLDSFALETPMATTNYPYHSPEIEYLKNGYNGVMTDDNVNDYATAVVKLIKDKGALNHLIQGCHTTAPLYNNEIMVRNFLEGIKQCLNDY